VRGQIGGRIGWLRAVVAALLVLSAGGCATLELSLPDTQYGSPGTLAGTLPADSITTVALPEVQRPISVAATEPSVSSPAESPSSGESPAAEQPPASSQPGESPPQAQSEPKAEEEFFDPFEKRDRESLAEAEDYDPWEPYNQAVFTFNRKLDQYLIKPVAKGYNAVVPDAVQRGISNFFFNVRFVPRLFNNLFQGKVKGAGVELSRFVVNSTVGLAGFFDPAKRYLGLQTPEEDFGQTLGYYGVTPGPYLLIPFWPGPFTIRDGVGFVVDLALDPLNWLVFPFFEIKNVPRAVEDLDTAFYINIGTRVFWVINERSLNLETFQGVEEATLDLYTAVRNGYLQKRARAIRE